MGIYKTITKTFMLQFHKKILTHACKLAFQLRLTDRLSLLQKEKQQYKQEQVQSKSESEMWHGFVQLFTYDSAM